MGIFEVLAATAQSATIITFLAKAARRCRKYMRTRMGQKK